MVINYFVQKVPHSLSFLLFIIGDLQKKVRVFAGPTKKKGHEELPAEMTGKYKILEASKHPFGLNTLDYLKNDSCQSENFLFFIIII
jgi:hypothetical protein